MTEDRRSPGNMPADKHERRDWCYVFAAGDGIMEVIADLADHYGAHPNQPWKPKGTTIEQLVAEVDAMRVALDRALMRSQRFINFVMEK